MITKLKQTEQQLLKLNTLMLFSFPIFLTIVLIFLTEPCVMTNKESLSKQNYYPLIFQNNKHNYMLNTLRKK